MRTTKDQRMPHRIPSDLKVAIARTEMKPLWDNLTPLAQNEWICYVISPKQEKTRMLHLQRTCEDLLNGKKRPCCWPGCPHRTSKSK
jgi:uncharacterized protein YdeI (YjbR/CyaY-like superfamily)